MRSLNRIAALALLAALLAPPALARNDNASANEIAVAALPREAQQTLQSIKRGGPFGYERDGVVFGNYERRLPSRQRGYYREYTVPTPGSPDRGARRLIAGTAGDVYYTADHYATFRQVLR
jgi:ribonuclease T1